MSQWFDMERLRRGRSFLERVLLRCSRYPDTEIYRNGQVRVSDYKLPGFVCLGGAIAHIYICHHAAVLLTPLMGGDNWLPSLVGAYWLIDFVYMPFLASKPMPLLWKPISLFVWLNQILLLLFRQEVRLLFTTDEIVLSYHFCHLRYIDERIKLQDVHHPVGGTAHGFYLEPPSESDIQLYQVFQSNSLLHWLYFLFIGEPVTPEHRYVKLFSGDAGHKITHLPKPWCDLFQRRLQNVLRNEISEKDFE